MTSVTGSEIVSALLRSSSNIFEIALPGSRRRTARCELGVRLRRRRSAEDRSTLSSACVGVALDLEVHDAEWPSARSARRCLA
jgi:hypothetical protein